MDVSRPGSAAQDADRSGRRNDSVHEGQQTSKHPEVPVVVFISAFGKESEAVRKEAGVAPLDEL